MTDIVFLEPDWPAPAAVRCAVSLRPGGCSEGAYRGLNLAAHVGDDSDAVARNRARFAAALALPADPIWLQQVHGGRAIRLDVSTASGISADAAWSDGRALVCAVLSADCLPLLLCARDGSVCAAIHAGWRGMLCGVIAGTIRALPVEPAGLLAWLGPAISAVHYEVDEQFYRSFIDAAGCARKRAARQAAFRAGRRGHYYADLYELARIELRTLGVTAIYGGDLCTFADAERFYSHRRDGRTGRMASVIWLA